MKLMSGFHQSCAEREVWEQEELWQLLGCTQLCRLLFAEGLSTEVNRSLLR